MSSGTPYVMPDEAQSLQAAGVSWPCKWFSPDEFACKCGCPTDPRTVMNRAFLVKLDLLRERCGFPLIVTSGYRCPKHNQSVSRTGPNGPHTTGRAVDLAVSRHHAWTMLRYLTAVGFTGIGFNQTGGNRFIHVDDLCEPDHAPRPTVWTY